MAAVPSGSLDDPETTVTIPNFHMNAAGECFVDVELTKLA
jgi:hypothetical protein